MQKKTESTKKVRVTVFVWKTCVEKQPKKKNKQ